MDYDSNLPVLSVEIKQRSNNEPEPQLFVSGGKLTLVQSFIQNIVLFSKIRVLAIFD